MDRSEAENLAANIDHVRYRNYEGELLRIDYHVLHLYKWIIAGDCIHKMRCAGWGVNIFNMESGPTLICDNMRQSKTITCTKEDIPIQVCATYLEILRREQGDKS